ncbi:MAG TPA: VWA domain-containing protein [Candidatus Dormibacteraeota bacterium]|nr:VWA domain-containing protein [Candidatus Dormibacteraeota bacterium]
MKSLRKIAVRQGICLFAAALFSTAGFVAAAQTPSQTPTNPDGAEQGTSSGGAAKQAPTPAAPQTPAPSGRQGTIVTRTTLVTVPVTVKYHDGRLVPDLHRDEFRLFEDNVEQKITSFTAEAFPLSIVVLIDNDLKSKDAQQVEASIKAVVAGMSAADEASICRFDQFFHEGKGFSANQDRLLTELQRTHIDDSRPQGAPPGGPFNGPTINGQAAPGVNQVDQYPSTRVIGDQHTKTIDDAVFSSAQLLEARPRERRKIILLISDGQNGAKFNTNSYSNVVKELQRNNIAVFSVAVGGAFFERKFTRLTEYTKATGGDTYYALKRGTMEELYSRITEQARHQYTLAYSPAGTDRGADYHTIEVRVEREGLNVTAREGYYTSGLQK